MVTGAVVIAGSVASSVERGGVGGSTGEVVTSSGDVDVVGSGEAGETGEDEEDEDDEDDEDDGVISG